LCYVIGVEHHLLAVAVNPRGHREEAGEGRVEGPVEIERTRGERIRLGIDQVYDPLAHVVTPAVARRCTLTSTASVRGRGRPVKQSALGPAAPPAGAGG